MTPELIGEHRAAHEIHIELLEHRQLFETVADGKDEVVELWHFEVENIILGCEIAIYNLSLLI